MYYVIKPLATPIIWVLLLMMVGLIGTRFSRGHRLFKAGWYSSLAALLMLLALSLDPVANLLTYSLENRHRNPSPEVLATLDVVVVLGGGLYPAGGLREYDELASEAYARFFHGLRGFRASGADILAFCGGSVTGGPVREAEVMRTMAIALGVPAEKIVIERCSRNTMENAAKLAAFLPGEGRRIGLVTSAIHMMRSKWAFEKAFPQDTIVPMPAHFTYDPPDWTSMRMLPDVGNVMRSTQVLHEWIGMLWYSLRY